MKRTLGRARRIVVLGALVACVGAKPDSEAVQFDLICDLHGKVIADPHPAYTGTYPANVKTWHYTDRYTVDLRAMHYCEVPVCGSLRPLRIAAVTPQLISFDNKPGVIISVRRRDNWYESRLGSKGEKVRLTTGFCRKAKFTGFRSLKS
jgi:hypothetical protein